MALIVQKYGGAALSNIGKIRQVAKGIAELYAQGNQVVVVVSAMGQVTDDLVRLAYSVAKEPAKREMDMLLSVGERMSMSLMAMAIEDTGAAKAVSFTGSQVGIITDTRHTEARIVEIRSMRLREALDAGKVVVVAGFQGVSLEKEITTLGRGGSDTTAVALAAALGADRCDLVKEVPGIFSADPTMIPEAVPIPEMDYGAAAGMSLGGARILKDACIDMARRYKIELRVGNSDRYTIVREKSAEPFFNLTLKNGLNLYEIEDSTSYLLDNGDWEILALGGKAWVIIEAESAVKNAVLKQLTAVDKDISRLAAVGDGLERIGQYIKEEPSVVRLYLANCSSREARYYLKTSDIQGIFRRIHGKMALQVFSEEKSDGGQ